MLTAVVWKLAGCSAAARFDTLLGRVADFLQAKASDDLARFQTGVAADTQIAMAQVNAQIEARKLQAQLMRGRSRLVGDVVDTAADRLSVRDAFRRDRARFHLSSRLGHRQAAAAL